MSRVQVHLPSGCQPYPEVDPEEVYLHTFKGKHQQIIAEMGPKNLKKKFLHLMEDVLEGPDPKLLTSGDVKHIMLWELINSYSHLYGVRFQCPACQLKVKMQVDLTMIESHEMISFSGHHEVELSDGKTMRIRPYTIMDEIESVNYALSGKSPVLYDLALTMILEDTNVLERLTMLENMDARDVQAIQQGHKELEHGPDMLAPFTCPYCDEEDRVAVPFRFDGIILLGMGS